VAEAFKCDAVAIMHEFANRIPERGDLRHDARDFACLVPTGLLMS
jgi:hypothetical protein